MKYLILSLLFLTLNLNAVVNVTLPNPLPQTTSGGLGTVPAELTEGAAISACNTAIGQITQHAAVVTTHATTIDYCDSGLSGIYEVVNHQEYYTPNYDCNASSNGAEHPHIRWTYTGTYDIHPYYKECFYNPPACESGYEYQYISEVWQCAPIADTNTTSLNCPDLGADYVSMTFTESQCTMQSIFAMYQSGDLDGDQFRILDVNFDKCKNTCYGKIGGCAHGEVVKNGNCIDIETYNKDLCPAPGVMECYVISLGLEIMGTESVSCQSRCRCDDILVSTDYVSCNDDVWCIEGYIYDTTLHECITIEEYEHQDDEVEDYENNTTTITVTEEGNTTTTTSTESHWDSDNNQTVTTTTTTVTDSNNTTTSSTTITTTNEAGDNPNLDTKNLNQEKTQKDILEKLDDMIKQDKESKDVLSSIDSKLMSEQNFTNAMVEALDMFFDINGSTNGTTDGTTDANATDQSGCEPGQLYDILSGECKWVSHIEGGSDGGGDSNGTSDNNDSNGSGDDINGSIEDLANSLANSLNKPFEHLFLQDEDLINGKIDDDDCPEPTFIGDTAYMGTEIENPLRIMDMALTDYYIIIKSMLIIFVTIGGFLMLFGRD